MTKNEFYSRWLGCFAKGITQEKIEKYVVATGNFLWHVFSWEMLDEELFLTGDEAKKAYDKADKRNAVYIEWFEDDEAKSLPDSLGTAAGIDEMTEAYVAAQDFSWTYIKTHESSCGPYFMKL